MMIVTGIVAILGAAALKFMTNTMSAQTKLSNDVNKEAVKMFILSSTSCDSTAAAATCTNPGDLVELRRMSGANPTTFVSRTGSGTKFGDFTVRAECPAAGQTGYVVRIVRLTQSGNLNSTADADFRTDPLTGRRTKWTDAQSLAFPSGVTLCANAGGQNNSVIYQKGCPWISPHPPTMCTPQACDAGEVDKGTSCEGVANVYGGTSGWAAGNCIRNCRVNFSEPRFLYVNKCAWFGDSLYYPQMYNCTPPTCAAGDTDKGGYCTFDFIGNNNGNQGMNGTWAGSCVRTCFSR